MQVFCYDVRRRTAELAARALRHMGHAQAMTIAVAEGGVVFVRCDTVPPDILAAILGAGGRRVPALPAMSRVVELYRGEATIRFRSGNIGRAAGRAAGNGARRR